MSGSWKAIGAMIGGLASFGCVSASLVHEASYVAMPLPSFSNSLGLKASAAPDSALGATDVKQLGEDAQVADQLSQYFGEWCGANHGVAGGDADSVFKTAFNEYRQQRLDAGESPGPGSVAGCRTRDGTSLGGYATFRENTGTLVAFYTPGELKAFTDKYEPAAEARRAGLRQKLEAEQQEVAHAKAQEDAMVTASGVGGTSIEQTLEIMTRARHDDQIAILSAIDHTPPCMLLIGGVKLPLKDVHVSVHEKQTDMVVNAITQEIGTRTTAILDVDAGAEHASVEFASGQNAMLNAQGIEHLAQLCGGGR